MPQIQGQIEEVVKILLERVQQILLERVQHRFVEQIADAHAPSVADETVECETGFEWPANEGTVCLTTNSTTATHTFPMYTGVMDDVLTFGPSFGCSASRQTATSEVRDTSYRDERTSKATEKKEHLEADVANMKFDAGVGEDPFARVMGLITEMINQLQKKALAEDIAVTLTKSVTKPPAQCSMLVSLAIPNARSQVKPV